MIADRLPVAPHHRFERAFTRLVTDVKDLKRANPFAADAQGRFQIGDVFIIQEANADGSITVSLQNANTLGPPVKLGDLT